MKITLIGASGFVGSSILNEALERGHNVTAIVRNPQKITVQNKNLTVIAADVMDEEKLPSLLKGNDAVISSYNPGWKDPEIFNHYLEGSQKIMNAVKSSGVKRFFVIGGAGSLEIEPGKQLVDSSQFPAEWKHGALAARDFLNIIRNENDLDWTFLSPAIMLHPGERTGKYRTNTDNPVFDENGKCEISVQDLAAALIDELENPKFIKKRFTVGY
jgi:hypothetical protein